MSLQRWLAAVSATAEGTGSRSGRVGTSGPRKRCVTCDVTYAGGRTVLNGRRREQRVSTSGPTRRSSGRGLGQRVEGRHCLVVQLDPGDRNVVGQVREVAGAG